MQSFHLSIGVKSIDESLQFFTETLGGKETHREASYANVEVFGHQITLKPNPKSGETMPEFHFGFNMERAEFDQLAKEIQETAAQHIQMAPKVVDAGTPMERKEMYLTCPTGYLIELKGY